MTDDGSGGHRVSQKERARQLRREAYQRAKAMRAKDPAYIALKEAMKQRRKEQYRLLRAKEKATRAEENKNEKHALQELRQEERRAADAELMQLLAVASPGSKLVN